VRELFAQPGANPECPENGERDEQDEDAGREADVEIRVGKVHMVAQGTVPEQQRKDGKTGSGEKGEEGRGHCQEQALKEAETLSGKPRNDPLPWCLDCAELVMISPGTLCL